MHLMVKKSARALGVIVLLVVVSLFLAPDSRAQSITFSQSAIASQLDTTPANEFFGSGASGLFPFTKINGSSGVATSIDALPVTTAATGGDPSKLTWIFGSLAENPLGPPILDLTLFDNGATTGVAIQEFTGSVPWTVSVDGAPVATGTIRRLRLETRPDGFGGIITTGTAFGLLTAPVGDPAVFNELLFSAWGAGTTEITNQVFIGLTTLGDGALFTSTGTTSFVPLIDSHTFRVVNSTGDPAPGTGGGTYGNALFVTSSLTNAGTVVFTGRVLGGSVSEGIFMDSDGIHSVVAIHGDPKPGGGTYVFPGSGPHNDSGDATLADASGVFVEGTSPRVVALATDTSPCESATWDSSFPTGINSSGWVAWRGNTFLGGPINAATEIGGVDRCIAVESDSAPGTGGGVYGVSISNPRIDAIGRSTFLANVTGSSVTRGFFRDSLGVDTPIVLQGDSAPSPGGGTFFLPIGGGVSLHSANALGDIVFTSLIIGGAASSGVFVEEGGVLRTVALTGDVAPGTGGGTFSGMGSPHVSDAGHVVFFSNIAGGSGATHGLFLEAGGAIQKVVLEGEALPEISGGILVDVFAVRGINDGGQVLFDARGDDPFDTLLYLTTPIAQTAPSAAEPAIPTLSAWGTLLLGSGLLALAAARRRAL